MTTPNNGWDAVGISENTGSKKERKYLKLETGTTVIRVLDAAPKVYWAHWILSANGGKGFSVKCPGSETCPICQDIKRNKDAGTKSIYSSRKQHALRVLHIKSPTDAEVTILDQGSTIFNQLKTYLTEMGDLRNYNIKIIKSGSSFGNISYQLMPEFPPRALEPHFLTIANDPDNVYDMEEYTKPDTAENINKFIAGATPTEVYSAKTEEAATPAPDAPPFDGGQPYNPTF